jgi:5-oxoprolinase (ATP-hydrolysing)/N-methylhydantoinase A
MKRIGVDVGGTFTDLLYWDDERGDPVVHKVPSTPDDPSRGSIEGIRELCTLAGVSPGEVEILLHGTTVATNIVLEHRGARVGLITTKGFRDILHIARKKRPYNFSSYQDVPWQRHPLVRRRDRLVVSERVTAPHGDVHTPLDLDEVRTAVGHLKDSGVEAVAVCFLFSFLNPDHELAVKRIVEEEFGTAYLSISSEVTPQYREYERFSTTALNSYIGPKVSRYVERFAEVARGEGIADVHMMTSAGGVVTSAGAARKPVSLLLSGPVAGLLAGVALGRASGRGSVITLDVGGTSADIGVAPSGELRMKHLLDTKIGAYDAMVPMVDLDAIGAGGGSIAYIDAGGMFRVGPRSAGADPGPVCYGRGGTEPTATDALVVLGWLRPESFLGGRMTIDAEPARAAIERDLAGPLGLSPEEAALGVFRILVHSMNDAISLNSVRKGYDPRDFALIAAGGAGPLFAWAIAEELGIPEVVVPRNPGITSATGLLTTDFRYEVPATMWEFASTLDRERLTATFERLTGTVIEQLRADGIPADSVRIERTADCRYVGQGYELRVALPEGPVTAEWIAETVERFEAAHERTYFRRFTGTEVQFVNVHVNGVGQVARLDIGAIEVGDADASAAVKHEADVLFPDGDSPTPVLMRTRFYDRDALRARNVIVGPAVIEQFDSTTIVGPGQRALVDDVGHLVIGRTE